MKKNLYGTLACIVIAVFSVGLFAFPQSLRAQPDEEQSYDVLAPLPGINDEDSSNPGTQVAIDENTLGEYLSIIYQIGVSIVFIIAVVTLVIGGLQYMTTDSVSSKGGARERISNAFIAILIAVGSYALLFLIGGPGAVSLDLDIESVGTRGGLERKDSNVAELQCNISMSAYQKCEGLGGGAMVIPEGHADYGKCLGPRPAGAECCLDPGGPEIRWISPSFTGDCSVAQLEEKTLAEAEDGTIAGCYDSLVRDGSEIGIAAQEATCEFDDIDHSSIDSFISFTQRATAPYNPGSACFNLNGVEMTEVTDQFKSNCVAKGGFYDDDNFKDGRGDFLLCFMPNASMEACMANIKEEAQFASCFASCTSVTGGYDTRYGGYSGHSGVDFAKAGCDSYGEPVTPVLSGVVAFIDDEGDTSDGYHVRIKHTLPDGSVIYTQYSHMILDSAAHLNAGDPVTAGVTKIGEVGNTGGVEGTSCDAHQGTHLHITFIENGTVTDPAKYFDSPEQMRQTLSGC